MTTTITTGHVGIAVTDLDRSRAFYERAFGWETLKAGGDHPHRFAFLGADGDLLVTLWEQATAAFNPESAGLHHLAFAVSTIDDVRAAEQRLHDLGAVFVHDGVVPHREGADSGGIFFTDPDGTRLEVYAPEGASGHAAPHGDAPTCGFF
jgi:catechol 2,3-dioxygenase-like lactoylglutathione lyase family enzyme